MHRGLSRGSRLRSAAVSAADATHPLSTLTNDVELDDSGLSSVFFFVTWLDDRGYSRRASVTFVLQIADLVRRMSLNLDFEGPIVNSRAELRGIRPCVDAIALLGLFLILLEETRTLGFARLSFYRDFVYWKNIVGDRFSRVSWESNLKVSDICGYVCINRIACFI